ncbi:MAG: hypothetical protein HY268_23750 [Deltaproteobacteria bacterium]|nr:hypothetical protein [Deltaproteobacteria bacterium]
MAQKEALTERLKYLTEVFRVVRYSCLPSEAARLGFGLALTTFGGLSLL